MPHQSLKILPETDETLSHPPAVNLALAHRHRSLRRLKAEALPRQHGNSE
jgi:hypothetical protein